MRLHNGRHILDIHLVSRMVANHKEPVVCRDFRELLLEPRVLGTAVLAHDILVELAWALPIVIRVVVEHVGYSLPGGSAELSLARYCDTHGEESKR